MVETIVHAALVLEYERCARLASHPEEDTTDLFGVPTPAERKRYYEFRTEALGFALDRFQRYGSMLVREFSLNEWLQLPGRGWVALVRIPSEDPLPQVGEPVVINGEVYCLTGVEAVNTLTDPPRRVTDMGLLIRGEPKHKET